MMRTRGRGRGTAPRGHNTVVSNTCPKFVSIDVTGMETEMMQSNKETKVSTKKVFSGKQNPNAIAGKSYSYPRKSKHY